MLDFNIALPSKPRVVSEEEFSGTFEIDGLYPGYGHTLGNSLRRIILSSLPGAAITSVKIDGVAHEFSTIEGVKEDVITILLNLKKLRFEMITDEPQKLSLSVKGARKVTGTDLEVPGQVKLLNPEMPLFEVTGKNTTLSLEMNVEKGIGYVPKEVLKKEKVDIGEISLDAAFSPIRRVNYEVENMRVGDRTDFNRLRITIETDGTVTARGALEKAIEIMIHQLKAVVGFREETVGMAGLPEAPETPLAPKMSEEDAAEMMKTRVETLPLSARTINALTKANIRTLGGLARKKEEDLLEVEGLGVKAIQEVKRALSNYGLTLK